VIVNGSAYNISEVWLPYYLVNTVSTPNPLEVLPGQDSGYILRFGINETIYKGKDLPISKGAYEGCVNPYPE
jgi:hypothetical protein